MCSSTPSAAHSAAAATPPFAAATAAAAAAAGSHTSQIELVGEHQLGLHAVDAALARLRAHLQLHQRQAKHCSKFKHSAGRAGRQLMPTARAV